MSHTTRTTKALLTLSLRISAAAALALALTVQQRAAGQSPSTNVVLKGTFASSVTDGVDIFTGKLEQVIPLLSVSGRGEISQGLYLPLRNSEWRVLEDHTSIGSDRTYYHYRAEQGNFTNNYARAGYTTLGKVVVETRYTGWYFFETPAVTSIIFTTNSGSIIQFRDTLTNGQPYDARSKGCVLSGFQPPNPPPACSRGRVFRATNGTSALFVADADIYDMLFMDAFGNPTTYPAQDNISGTIYLGDGTRVRVGGSNNNITRITDRNGNYMNVEYVTEPNHSYNFLKKITDSLNREITISYGDSEQPSFYDEIIYKGFGGSERRIRVNYAGIGTVMLQGHSLGVPLFPGVQTRCVLNSGGAACDATPAGGVPGAHYAQSIKVPASIVLPNNTEYQFFYNKYLELARIRYPTGSTADYSYTGVTGADAEGYTWAGYGGGGIYRRVGSVKNSDETGQTISEKVFSNIPEIIGTAAPLTLVDNVTVDVKDGAGTVVSKSRHYFYNYPLLEGFFTFLPMTWAKEYKTEVLHPDTSALLRRTEMVWKQREPFPWCGSGSYTNFYGCDTASDPDSGPENDPRLTEVKTTLETGQVAKRTFGYDQHNNNTDTYESDYGVGQPGPLLRRVHTEYVTDPNYTSHTATYLPRLPLLSWVSSDADGINKASFMQYEYDNYTGAANHAALVPRSNVSGFDPDYHAGYTRRGNPTARTTFADAQNQTGSITTYMQFDILGNVVKSIDDRGYASTIDYSDHFGGANGEARGNWDTVSAPPQMSGLNGFAFATSAANPLGHTTHTQYDYSTGLVVDAEDVKGNVTTSVYNDPLDRATQVITANNRPALRHQQTFVFDDAGRKVTTTSDLFAFGDNLVKSESFYDCLGQTIETRSFETGGYIANKFQYDAVGRAVQVSNAYRPHLNESPLWTVREYDALGRTTRVQTPDGSEAVGVFNGNVTTTIDQAGKQRRRIANALGRLVRADEPNGQNDLGALDNPAQATSYQYNGNGQVVRVTQGEQSRYFLYDSAGRLVRVRQPEQGVNSGLNWSDPVTGNGQWSTGSTYDGNGNTLTTADAKGVVVTYTYDGLNRILTRSYSDSTPTVTYTYDDTGIAHSKGLLTKVSSSISTTEYTSFDELGRVLGHRQTTGGQPYTTAYTYGLSGALVEQTYPSGRVVKNTFNNDARLSDVSSKAAGQSAFQVYANNFAYTAAGSVSQMRFGNNTWETRQFNSRLQVTQISLGSSQGGTDLLNLVYEYGELDAGGNLLTDKNSGVVARQAVGFAGLGQPFVQTFKYDTLDRLTEAVEKSGGAQMWRQDFGYDRYGNRTSINQQKVGEQSVTQTPAVNPANNRLADGQGFVYDPNGNVTLDNAGRQFAFNGDNRQVEVKDSGNNVVGVYYYDGDGQRVKKVTAWESTVFVYSASGQLVAEYSTQQGGSLTSYVTPDKLGSPRVVTNAAGAVVSRRDFMSFGEELRAGTAGRTAAQLFGNGIDNLRQRFTGYEKDVETGLDFAEARYYDNRYGRFTAVDPLLASGLSDEPQSFNRYAYVMNNPVNATDPTGMWAQTWIDSSDLFIGHDDLPSVRHPIPYREWVTTYKRGGKQSEAQQQQARTEKNNAAFWNRVMRNALEKYKDYFGPPPETFIPPDTPVEVIITNENGPKLIAWGTKILDKAKDGYSVPINGRFQIWYKYLISDTEDPGAYGRITAVRSKAMAGYGGQTDEGLMGTGTIADATIFERGVDIIQVDKKKGAIIVTKTETYRVVKNVGHWGGTWAVNYRIEITSPVSGRARMDEDSTIQHRSRAITIRNVLMKP